MWDSKPIGTVAVIHGLIPTKTLFTLRIHDSSLSSGGAVSPSHVAFIRAVLRASLPILGLVAVMSCRRREFIALSHTVCIAFLECSHPSVSLCPITLSHRIRHITWALSDMRTRHRRACAAVVALPFAVVASTPSPTMPSRVIPCQASPFCSHKIGRASCRERVCLYV